MQTDNLQGHTPLVKEQIPSASKVRLPRASVAGCAPPAW